ncbi:uncharacterized protein BYT42DRAFT_251883 [Radiomyces spectabilis]|uniref:uncharacterized protein n=1 Tax=Radiomyces spectabilis TaxID=64574 RepID=UPI00221F3D45|nr:uncharacterized protein BYT42DRAFT_251883 [Radiomyces spectabilis]KAI8388918.1 hypothetical protein BYT42DRAFT_251883 [Radiomyces spectabilis]
MSFLLFASFTRTMEDKEHHEGQSELAHYISNTKHPSFESFVLNNLENIAHWSRNLNNDDLDLHDIWACRYTKLLKSLQPHLKTKSLKFNKALWHSVSELKALLRTDHLYNEKSIELIGEYSKKAEVIVKDHLDRQLANSAKRHQPMGNADRNEDSLKKKGKRKQTSPEECQDNPFGEGSSRALIAPANIPSQLSNDSIFKMGYKKLAGLQWDDTERQLFKELHDGNPFVGGKTGLVSFIVNLLQSLLSTEDLPIIKLSLSGIVNQMNPRMFEQVKPYLTGFDYERRFHEVINSLVGRGLKEDVSAMVDEVNESLMKDGVEASLDLIDDLKKPSRRNGARSQQGYRVLLILGYLIRGNHD